MDSWQHQYLTLFQILVKQSKSTASPLLTNLSFVNNLFFIANQDTKTRCSLLKLCLDVVIDFFS